MSITLQEAIDNELISDQIINVIPRKCKCGSNIVISDSLKEIKCSNINCIYKTINRIYNASKLLSIGLQESDIKNIVNKLGIVTPYQLLMLDGAYDKQMINSEDIIEIDNIIQNIKNIKQNDYYIYNIVEMCGIEKIRIIAKKLFYGFESFDEAYNEIEQGQISFISERLGMSNPDGSTFAYDIYKSLIELKDEFIFGEMQLNIKKCNKKRLFVAFSDNVIPYVNKSEYLDYLNNNYNYEFVLITTISDNTDILIKNSVDTSGKYRAARIINDKVIASGMNSGELTISSINRNIKGQLKPLGCNILVTTTNGLIDKLNEMKGSKE